MALAATPAFAIDLEKWATDLANREMERWQKEKLETAIKGRDPAARLKAVEGLSHHDADSLAAFAIALGDSDARVRRAAANKLWSAEKKAEPYRVPLTRALDDTDSNVVAYAAGALQASGVKEADLTAPRQRVFESSDASVTSRFLVSRNLIGHQPPAKIAAAMIAYLERNSESQTGRAGDTNRENVALAERGLERLLRTSNDRGLIQPLREALVETKNAHIPLMKTLALFEPKPEGWTQTLLKQLENTAPRVRHAALGHLRAVKEEAEVVVWAPRAAAMLQDPDAPVRAEALWALESARGAAAGEIERVAAALTDPNPLVRRNAARALGEIGEATQAIPAATQARLAATARPALDLALQDGDRDVREEAKSALTKIAGRAGSEACEPRSSPPHRTNRPAWPRFARAR